MIDDDATAADGTGRDPEPTVLNLIDASFAHDVGAVAGQPPRHVRWDRLLTDPERDLVITDGLLLRPKPRSLRPSALYGLLIESAAITPWTYRLARVRVPRFDLVFTHNSGLLDRFDNCRWIPGGGVWIGGSHGGGTVGVHEKTRLCSMVSSHKRSAELHRFRLDIAHTLKERSRHDVDVYLPPPHVPISRTLESYRYSICIENNIDELYFTEKLLNCFATGTIPIYRGAPGIGTLFDMDGVLAFDTARELDEILGTIGAADYERRRGAVDENLARCRRYMTIEDYIHSAYLSAPDLA